MLRFLAMGGYAAYVWPSVAITVAVMLLNVYWARRATRAAERLARRRVQLRQEAS
ncbi:MAG: heme exporter protein CcmD [Gammaproteobacteria bacterium]|nr:heme exporter protein CcmD [Gammaproteobacteria bacterium]